MNPAPTRMPVTNWIVGIGKNSAGTPPSAIPTGRTDEAVAGANHLNWLPCGILRIDTSHMA